MATTLKVKLLNNCGLRIGHVSKRTCEKDKNLGGFAFVAGATFFVGF